MFRFGAPDLGVPWTPKSSTGFPVGFELENWDDGLLGEEQRVLDQLNKLRIEMKHFSKTATAGGGNSDVFVIFTPDIGKVFPFWRAYVSKGVGNHQLDSRCFLRFCCYRIGFQTHDEDMCSITVGEDMVEVKHLTTLLCWWTPMVVFHAKKKHKSAPSHWVPGDVKLILEAWCTLTPKPFLDPVNDHLASCHVPKVRGQGPRAVCWFVCKSLVLDTCWSKCVVIQMEISWNTRCVHISVHTCMNAWIHWYILIQFIECIQCIHCVLIQCIQCMQCIHTYAQADWQTDRPTDRQPARQTDRQTDP